MFIITCIYVIIFTCIPNYSSKIENKDYIEGTIVDISATNDKVSFILKEKEKVKCNYYIKNYNDINYNEYLGKKVKVYGNKKDIYNNTIPNTFNYKNYLYNNKIYLFFEVNKIEIIKDENIFYKLKNKIIERINNLDNSTKIYVSLFVLGNKEYLNDIMYDNYRINGIWHLFAVSGMHINLIILFIDKILKRIKFKNIIISFILLYFMFLTGFSASVQRVSIFFYLKSIFKYYDIKIDNKKILFLTAFIIILFNPFIIFNAGFQYSFLITLAIMLESKFIKGTYFKQIFKISIISFMVSLPITINMNYEINILSVFLNIIYVPFISLIFFPLSIMTFIFPFISSILNILINVLEYSNTLFYNIKLSIIIPKLSMIIFIFYYIFLYLFHKLRLKKYIIFVIIFIVLNMALPKLDDSYYVDFIDVNQGDSSIIITPYKNEVIMIDTGGLINSDYYISNNTMLYLKSIGINKIDFLIISHGDYDHMGDAINLVKDFKVKKVIFNCGKFNELEQELIKVLEKRKIPYYSCIKKLNIDNNKLYFLNNKDYGNENDNSSVIYTELNNHKFLFTGDAGVKVEEDIIEKYNLQDIDVLKIGHHGSKTSSSKKFIDEITPKYSVISVGKNNRYGHPNKEVLDNLKDSKIYRTDIDGSIMFKIKNNKLKIETCTP